MKLYRKLLTMLDETVYMIQGHLQRDKFETQEADMCISRAIEYVTGGASPQNLLYELNKCFEPNSPIKSWLVDVSNAWQTVQNDGCGKKASFTLLLDCLAKSVPSEYVHIKSSILTSLKPIIDECYIALQLEAQSEGVKLMNQETAALINFLINEYSSTPQLDIKLQILHKLLSIPSSSYNASQLLSLQTILHSLRQGSYDQQEINAIWHILAFHWSKLDKGIQDMFKTAFSNPQFPDLPTPSELVVGSHTNSATLSAANFVIPTTLQSGVVIPTTLQSGVVIPTTLQSGVVIPTTLQSGVVHAPAPVLQPTQIGVPTSAVQMQMGTPTLVLQPAQVYTQSPAPQPKSLSQNGTQCLQLINVAEETAIFAYQLAAMSMLAIAFKPFIVTSLSDTQNCALVHSVATTLLFARQRFYMSAMAEMFQPVVVSSSVDPQACFMMHKVVESSILLAKQRAHMNVLALAFKPVLVSPSAGTQSCLATRSVLSTLFFAQQRSELSVLAAAYKPDAAATSSIEVQHCPSLIAVAEFCSQFANQRAQISALATAFTQAFSAASTNGAIVCMDLFQTALMTIKFAQLQAQSASLAHAFKPLLAPVLDDQQRRRCDLAAAAATSAVMFAHQRAQLSALTATFVTAPAFTDIVMACDDDLIETAEEAIRFAQQRAEMTALAHAFQPTVFLPSVDASHRQRCNQLYNATTSSAVFAHQRAQLIVLARAFKQALDTASTDVDMMCQGLLRQVTASIRFSQQRADMNHLASAVQPVLLIPSDDAFQHQLCNRITTTATLSALLAQQCAQISVLAMHFKPAPAAASMTVDDACAGLLNAVAVTFKFAQQRGNMMHLANVFQPILLSSVPDEQHRQLCHRAAAAAISSAYCAQQRAQMSVIAVAFAPASAVALQAMTIECTELFNAATRSSTFAQQRANMTVFGNAFKPSEASPSMAPVCAKLLNDTIKVMRFALQNSQMKTLANALPSVVVSVSDSGSHAKQAAISDGNAFDFRLKAYKNRFGFSVEERVQKNISTTKTNKNQKREDQLNKRRFQNGAT
jgi:hypothetical protein